MAGLVAAMLPCAVLAANGGGATITEITFSASADNLMIAFKVDGAVTEELVETLDSGLPVRFIYRVKVSRRASMLMGATLANLNFERVLEKDNLKGIYTISQDDRSVELKSFEEAMEVMTEVEDVETVPLSSLLGGEKYRAEVQVKLEEFRLPFHLHKILPFMSMWDIETPWKRVNVPREFYGKR